MITASHAPPRTHIISNQQASPITLAKSTAIGPKAMRYRNGLMRIVISAAPQPLARPQHHQSAACWGAKPRPRRAGLKSHANLAEALPSTQLTSTLLNAASAPGKFGARALVPERRAPPKRGQVYCGRKGLWTSAAKQFGGCRVVPTAASTATRITKSVFGGKGLV